MCAFAFARRVETNPEIRHRRAAELSVRPSGESPLRSRHRKGKVPALRRTRTTALFLSILAVVTLLQWNHFSAPKTTQEQSKYAINPNFDGIHNFSLGPRHRFDTGPSQSALRNYEGAAPFSGTFRCVAHGEAFAAAWLSTVETFMQNDLFSEAHLMNPNCKWCPAMAAGFFMAHRRNLAYRTVDMFDFFVHHLSYYEKMLSRNFRGNGACNFEDDEMRNLGAMEEGYRIRGYNNPTGRRNGKVLAIMPFFSGTKHNKLRPHKFLNISVLAVSHVFPNIVVCVATEEDYQYVTQESGLNRYLYDVMLVSGLNGTNYLPLGCNVRTKPKIANDTWSGFEWIFYTESDQMPHLRDVDQLLHLALQEKMLIIPHRGVPYAVSEDFSEPVTARQGCDEQRLKRTAAKTVQVVPNILSKSCCFDALYCSANTSKYHVHFDKAEVQMFRQYESWALVAGTGNVFKETYQICNMSSGRNLCQGK